MKSILAAILFIFASTILHAKTDPTRWCGTQRGTQQTELFIKNHQRHVKEIPVQRNSMEHFNQDIGEIAVIEGSTDTIIQPNSFDLKKKKIFFDVASAGVYDVRVQNGSASGAPGGKVNLGDDASTEIKFNSGFSFPFFGKTYTSVFLNSDGNLTFTEKDDASSPRNVFRALQGPPRIAIFFADLDPSRRGEIRVSQSATKVIFTWKNVPEFGKANSNTFQLTLFKTGDIQIAFGSTVDGKDAIVGISPGNAGSGKPDFIDYSKDTPESGVRDAIFERFAAKEDLDFIGLIQEFHDTHPKVFELITIFTDRTWLQGTGAFAFFSPIKNNDQGIGRGIYDFTNFFGSSKIEGFLMMDDINKYPTDENLDFLGTNNTLDIMGQEMGHRWMAFPKIKKAGLADNEILGRDDSHWSWFFDSDASDMEGNNWQDNGNGTFKSIEATERYSLLDRYLMGLIPASQVAPFFVLRGPGQKGTAPQVNIQITATKFDLTINDIIAAEGPRIPSSSKAKKKWKLAFIYFIEPGTTPDPAAVARVDDIRKSWEAYFNQATGGKGKVITNLP